MGKYIKIAEDRVVEMYLSNDYKMSEICSYFGVSKMKIRTVLKNKNIESKTSKKYSYNENVFENIDNEESAYWLGFLYADGYVRYREKYGSELRLKLSVRDKDHLLKFKKFITSDDTTIYDPFSGIGTTARGCKMMNRNFIGSELKEEYYDLSLKLLEQKIETQNEIS